MQKNIKGELTLMKNLNIKPNYAALSREYNMDWRTVKKYYDGYEGRSTTRIKQSKLDIYKDEISDKLKIKRLSSQGVYEFLVSKYGVNRIGTYSNFIKYVNKNKMKPKVKIEGHPRYEKAPGEQAQVDWKEDISINSKNGEKITINVLNVTLKYSRYCHIELSIQKRFDDVARGIINAFKRFGGVPKELLFDNMSTVANVNAKPKKPTDSIMKMGKEFGFKIRLCRSKSPETKGSVEAKNKIIDWIRAYDGEFETIEELIERLENINQETNTLINQETSMSPTALFYKEKEYLQALPNKNIIDAYLTPNRYKISNEALIRYNNCKYSIDPKLIGEEVTIDILDNKLYIYYNGKLITIHEITEKCINYKEEHYAKLMQGKIKENKLESVVSNNLEMMDKLLESRTVKVSTIEASKSTEALIAYINQSTYGKWVINNFAHLSAIEKITFIKGINEVLPYVKNTEAFISHIKYSMKNNLCKTIAFDCLINDLMCMDKEEIILSDEGYNLLKGKYEDELNQFLNEMRDIEQLDISKQQNSDVNNLESQKFEITTNELPFD